MTRSKQNRNKDAENAAKVARLVEEQDTMNIMIKREIEACKDLSGEINRIGNRLTFNIKNHRFRSASSNLSMFQEILYFML